MCPWPGTAHFVEPRERGGDLEADHLPDIKEDRSETLPSRKELDPEYCEALSAVRGRPAEVLRTRRGTGGGVCDLYRFSRLLCRCGRCSWPGWSLKNPNIFSLLRCGDMHARASPSLDTGAL